MSIPFRIRSLDAVHLATALIIDDAELVMVSNDDKLLTAAKAMGLSVQRLR